MNKKITRVSIIFLAIIFTLTVSIQKHYAYAQTTLEWITLGVLDRSGDGIPDIRFGGEDQGDNIREVSFDNNQDGKYDYGFLDMDTNNKLDSMWIDRNGNGQIEINEVNKLGGEFQWATFPSSLTIVVNETNDSITYLVDYTGDGLFDQVLRDLDKDGDIETDALAFATTVAGESVHYFLSLNDSDNDGDYDRGRFGLDTGTKTVRFPKPIQKQLSVFEWFEEA